MASTAAGTEHRFTQLKAFDDTKAGVKGLVDAGVTTVPPIFHHPPDPHGAAAAGASLTTTIPVIDLAATFSATNDTSAAHQHHHRQLVAEVKAAAETAGFFHVVNHGVPAGLLARTLAAVRAFHESPADARRRYYSRNPARRVRYESNFDLFSSPAANWRDTVAIQSSAAAPDPEELPPALPDAVPEYTRRVRALGARLLALLSEALLGLRERDAAGSHQLQRDAGCLDEWPALACHYYPPCPEPELTLGTTGHSDPTFVTVLLQDGGGLQALVGGVGWVDVPQLPGALVVNIGDLTDQVFSPGYWAGTTDLGLKVPAPAAREPLVPVSNTNQG